MTLAMTAESAAKQTDEMQELARIRTRTAIRELLDHQSLPDQIRDDAKVAVQFMSSLLRLTHPINGAVIAVGLREARRLFIFNGQAGLWFESGQNAKSVCEHDWEYLGERPAYQLPERATPMVAPMADVFYCRRNPEHQLKLSTDHWDIRNG